MRASVGVRAVCLAGAAGMALLASQGALAAPSGWLAVDGNIRFNGLGGATVDWANPGSGAANSCPVGAVNLSGAGGLFNCGRLGAAGGPPIAPTLTPQAAADPSIISSPFIVDPISTDTTSCGAGDPTIVGGGAKNGQPLNTIVTTTGSVPDKDDLANVYAVSHTRADTGHPEVYFAAERLVNNGDSHIDFEFLQSQMGVSAPCQGRFVGHRTEGDLLVAVDFTGGGTTAGATVYQWHCAAEPGPQPADGTVCDPTLVGPVQHYQPIAVPSFLTFTVNTAGSIPCGGWVCRDKLSGSSSVVSARDFLEGGVDLAGIPFAGCFNTFLPHTRTAQSFTSGLKDFAGPVGLKSCRDPAMSSTSSPNTRSVAPGTSVMDNVNVGNGGAGPTPTGTVTFFLCAPGQTAASGCIAGGTQVGAAKTLAGGSATSDSTTVSAAGTYCWRTEYTPDAASTGVFNAGTHTNSTSECFAIATPPPGLPNTGAPVPVRIPPAGAGVIVVPMILGLVWRRTRKVEMVAIASLLAMSVPDAINRAPTPAVSAHLHAAAHPPVAVENATRPVAGSNIRSTREWRLVIPEIGVNAPIDPVGLDAQHAMSVPWSLDRVGWYDRGPLPGQRGDAVIAGHLGLPSEPGVFRDLDRLRVGDRFQVVWPDGHRIEFRVTKIALVSAAGPTPDGLFTRSGPAHLSLVTCAGAWDQGRRTYDQRLIVAAVPLA